MALKPERFVVWPFYITGLERVKSQTVKYEDQHIAMDERNLIENCCTSCCIDKLDCTRRGAELSMRIPPSFLIIWSGHDDLDLWLFDLKSKQLIFVLSVPNWKFGEIPPSGLENIMFMNFQDASTGGHTDRRTDNPKT